MTNQFVPESEESYKDLFDNAHDLIHFASLNGTLLHVNPSWMRVLGYDLEDIVGRPIFSFVHPAFRETFVQYREGILTQPLERKQIITCLTTKKGAQVFVEGSISVRSKNGSAVYTRAILRDITERLKQEEQLRQYNTVLRERESSLQQLLNNAPDAVIVIDSASRVRFWNPKAEAIFGWKAAEVMGSGLSDTIIPEMYRNAHNEGMKHYLVTGESHVLNKTIEITALKKDGTEFYISLTISRTGQQENATFIAFIRDISVQKRNDAELERKRKELEETNKELEQFAFAASHDLQEPLRKIQTFAGLLLDREEEKLSEPGKMYLTKIAASAARMKSLIDALLHYSHQTQQLQVFTNTDLNATIQTVLADLELTIQQKAAQVVIDPLPVVKGVPVQMEQLFYNLLNNALKFSNPDTRPQIRMGHQTAPDENMVEIFVADNGIGFDAQHAEKIFGLFQRLNDKTAFEGTGIGLTLCKKIVTQHGGTIRAESTPGKGTTFFVQLPAGS